MIILLFAFIFVGVQAFAIPGAFGSVVNSVFTVDGGFGLKKANS